MRKRLLNNLGLKIISLILAFLLWFMVVQTADPKDDRDVGNVTVTLIHTELLEQENKVYEILDDTDKVRVTVYAPRSVLKQLRSGDILAEADVSKLTDISTVPITFSSPNVDVSDIKGSHDTVRLNVEDKASKYVALKTYATGTVAEGYMVSSLTPDQNRIEVSGPKSVVEQVKEAGVTIDVTDATSNLSANIDIKLYDAGGSLIERDNLVKNVDYVRLSVEVLAVREVPVILEMTGVPADGYMATGVIESDPGVVKIAGSTYALNQISQIVVPQERLDISGESSDKADVIDVREYLPENVKLADNTFNGKISVVIPIEPVVSRDMQIPVSNLSVRNLPDGLEALIDESGEKTYELQVKGLGEQLELLRPDHITGVIDVAEWMKSEKITRLRPGTYTVPITFILEDNIVADNAPTARIVVKEKEN